METSKMRQTVSCPNCRNVLCKCDSGSGVEVKCRKCNKLYDVHITEEGAISIHPVPKRDNTTAKLNIYYKPIYSPEVATGKV